MQPLHDVTVVDFTRYLSGPYATMILGDYGADVIKVETMGTGDESRHMAPFVNGESYASAMPNRNKRSIALDLKSAEGARVARDLIARADVVVENFRPGVTTRLGIDYEQAHALNSEVIYCSVTGFGQTGPESSRAGFDIIAQGMAGFLRLTGQPGGEPAKFGVAITDLVAGMTSAQAVLAAYIRRLREGGGQYIDVALVDAGLALTVWEAGSWFGAAKEPVAEGTRHRLNAPYQAFRTSDGYVTVGANNDRLWQRFCTEVIDRPDLLDRAEYIGRSRPEHVALLEKELQEVLECEDTAHWVAALDRAGVPGGPVLTYSEAVAQAQVTARDMVVELEHPVMGTMRVLGVPAKLSATPASIRRPAPLLGEHTREVLRELGRTESEVDSYLADGVVEQAPEPTPRAPKNVPTGPPTGR